MRGARDSLFSGPAIRSLTFPNALWSQVPIPANWVDWGKFAAQTGNRISALSVLTLAF